MGKKAREYKSGDFIFAKVKGYPAWPARVQRLNGKKYFVYFYGTGETANLPPNMIFDYAENKDKFLTKTQKRRDFKDGVKQIEHDFANNVPLEDVIGVPIEVGTEAPANDTANDSALNETIDDTVDTTANDTADDDTIANTTQNEGPVEDSDETGALVIDEGKATKKKTKADAAKTPAKETPKAKEAKTPRGKAKKEDDKPEENDEKKDEEIVSRSGRKIRPKRFVDEQTEDNSTLPSPAPKKKRVASPSIEKEKEKEKEKPEPKDKNIKSFNAVTQSELEELKQPFKPEDADKENILIAYLPSGKYVGIKLFQSRPVRFKNEATRLQWDKQAASNAITLKMQLERGQITALSVQGQLVMDLNLTDEEKATLDKERETEEKKSRVQFLKTEMKLIELDAKIKTCLSLEKADAELCLQMLDELNALDVKPLMLLKHPTCLETVKRMRAYVGNTPSWDLTENAAILFSKQAHRIRKSADTMYKHMKDLFTTPDGLSFWEYFSERVLQFKKVAAKLSASELLEMVHEPIEMSQPTSHTMTAAIDAANEDTQNEEPPKKKPTPAKPKKTANNNTPVTPKAKRHSSRKQTDAENEDNVDKSIDESHQDSVDNENEPESLPETTADVEKVEATKEPEDHSVSDKEVEVESGKTDKSKDSKKNKPKEGKKSLRNIEKNAKDAAEKVAIDDKSSKDTEKGTKDDVKGTKDDVKDVKDDEKVTEDAEKAADEENNSKNLESSKDDESSAMKEDESTPKDNENTSKDEINTKDAEKTETEPIDKKSPKKGSKDIPKEDKNSKKPEKNSEEPEKNLEETSVANTEQTNDEKGVKTKKDDKKKGKESSKDGEGDKKKGKESSKDSDKGKESEKRKDDDKAKEDTGEPRAKRSRETRETKKTDVPPPRSPAKRKSKY